MAYARHVNGASVRAIREALGIRGVDLAERASISKSTLSLVEQGAREVSAATLGRLSKALGVSVEAISYVRDTSDDR